jgi:hypothetical protein
MTADIIDFDKRRQDGAGEPVVDDARQSEAEAIWRQELETADGIVRRLKDNPKLDHHDRRAFAVNLGRMIEKAFGKAAKEKLPNLFLAAFLKATSTAHLKKRKRFVRLPGEDAPEADRHGEYHARGLAYLHLAEALAAHAPEEGWSPEDNRRRAVLSLIEGSIFDSRSAANARGASKEALELIEALDTLAENVGYQAMLHEMRHQAKRLNLFGRTDRMTGELTLDRAVHRDFLGDTLDLMGEEGLARRSPLSPRVLLARFQVPVEVAAIIPLDVASAQERPDREAALKEAADRALGEADGRLFAPSPEEAPACRLVADADAPRVFSPILIWLELRFDPVRDRWRPVIFIDDLLGYEHLDRVQGNVLIGQLDTVFVGAPGGRKVSPAPVRRSGSFTPAYVLCDAGQCGADSGAVALEVDTEQFWAPERSALFRSGAATLDREDMREMLMAPLARPDETGAFMELLLPPPSNYQPGPRESLAATILSCLCNDSHVNLAHKLDDDAGKRARAVEEIYEQERAKHAKGLEDAVWRNWREFGPEE